MAAQSPVNIKKEENHYEEHLSQEELSHWCSKNPS